MTTQPPAPPPPQADLIMPVLKAAAIVAAGQLGLFKTLADGPRTIPELARALGASETGVARLVEALAGVGYLERVDGGYANGPAARAWLTPSSPVDFTSLLLWAPTGWPLLGSIDQMVRRGGPERPLYDWLRDHPDKARIFGQYMRAMAQLSVGPMTEMVPIPGGARRLLDLGGSHGLYSFALCRRHPALQAVVYDVSEALVDTEAAIAAEGLAGQVSVQRGDYLSDDIGRGYDIVLCFFLLHNHTENDNRLLLGKVAGALNPGGLAVIYEFQRSEPPDAFSALYGLLMFMYSGTRVYNGEEISGWLKEAGLGDVRQVSGPMPGMTTLITAAKPM